MIGFGVVGGSCATQTKGPSQETADTASIFVFGTINAGQSFVAAGTGTVYLHHVVLTIYPQEAVTATMRIGSSTDLTSYLGQTTAALSGYGDYTFTFDPVVELTGGDTYYFGLANSSSQYTDSFSLDVKSGDPYGDGISKEGSSWVLGSDANTDANFKIYMCD